MLNRKDKEIDVLMEELTDSRELLEQINYMIMDYFHDIQKCRKSKISPEHMVLHEVKRLEKRFNILLDMNETHINKIQDLAEQIQAKLRE